MAGLNIKITIGADDKATGPLGKIKKALGGVSDTAKKGFSGLQNIVGNALIGGASIGVGAIVGIGTAAFDVSQSISDTAASMQSDLGVTADEAERFADIAANAWGNNFFESVQDAGAAVAEVKKQLGDMPDDELQRTVENAARLGDSFELDAGESINTVKTLMEEFGLTSDQAFDFVTKGMQSGLNANGDFVDSIGEYSNLFADAGYDADQFFSIMETGQAGGVLGTDKIADSIKEMGIILSEGGDDAKAAFDLIGLSYDDIAGQVASGDADWADYFDQIVGGLSDIDDPMKRQQAQVALFGTMAEDLGVSFTDGLSAATTSLDDMAGATDGLDARYNTLGDVVEGFKRRGMLALQPIGDLLLDLSNRIMPYVEDGFAFLEAEVVPAIELVADVVQSFIGNLEEGMSPLDAFIEAIWDIAPQGVLDFLIQLRDEILPQLSEWFTTNVQPIIDMAAGYVEWNDVLTAIGVVVAAVVLPALAGIVAAAAPVIAVGALLVGAIALARNAWENDWGGIQEKVQVVGEWFQNTLFPILSELWTWLGENVPAALETMRAFWVDEAWPVIDETIQAVWGFMEPNILTPLGEWLEEKIPVALEVLRAFWVDVVWPGILESIDAAWERIKFVLEGYQTFFETTLPAALETIKTKWAAAWSFIGDKIEKAMERIQPIFEAITGFQSWISSVSFDFSFNIPSLPDWMIPGSPIPLHTAWKDYGDYLNQHTFEPQFNIQQAEQALVLPAPAGRGEQRPAAAVVAGGGIPQAAAVSENKTEIIVNIYDQAGAALFLNYLEAL